MNTRLITLQIYNAFQHPFLPPQPRTFSPRTLHPPTRHAALASTLRMPSTKPTFALATAGAKSWRFWPALLAGWKTRILSFAEACSSGHTASSSVVHAFKENKRQRDLAFASRVSHIRLSAVRGLTFELGYHPLPPAAGNMTHLGALAALRAHPSKVDQETIIQASRALGPKVLTALPSHALLALSHFLVPTFWASSTGSVAARIYHTSHWFGVKLDALLRISIRRRLALWGREDRELCASATAAPGTGRIGTAPTSTAWGLDQMLCACQARGIDLVCSVLHGCDSSGGGECVSHRSNLTPQCCREKGVALRSALLSDWADLHVHHGVSPVLLVLSSVVMGAQQSQAQATRSAAMCAVLPRDAECRVVQLPKGTYGYAVALHALLTHVPAGLDSPHCWTVG